MPGAFAVVGALFSICTAHIDRDKLMHATGQGCSIFNDLTVPKSPPHLVVAGGGGGGQAEPAQASGGDAEPRHGRGGPLQPPRPPPATRHRPPPGLGAQQPPPAEQQPTAAAGVGGSPARGEWESRNSFMTGRRSGTTLSWNFVETFVSEAFFHLRVSIANPNALPFSDRARCAPAHLAAVRLGGVYRSTSRRLPTT